MPLPLPIWGWEGLGTETGKRLGVRDTWSLEQRGNELRVDKPQDGVEGPHPPEVDIAEAVAQLLHQPHAFFVALYLGKEKAEASPGKRTGMVPLPGAAVCLPQPTPRTPSAWITPLPLP